MKAAPVIRAVAERNSAVQVLIHTGQHYDADMSEIFFRQLDLPEPDVNLGVGSGSHAFQTAQIMMHLEEVVLREKPDLVLVYGDVNSTMAGAVVCSKLLIPVGHVEAGLRSNDRTMPEEINRLLTDQVSDLLFTPSADADDNLLREGLAKERIHRVGNVMIDTLVRLRERAAGDGRKTAVAGAHALPPGLLEADYGLATLHRPSNVDRPVALRRILETLVKIGRDFPIVFPIHPRTRSRMAEWGLETPGGGVHLIGPLGYLEFLALQRDARFVVTDSGGIQEETTFLGVPCLTLRENTERPVTVTVGTNILVGQDMDRLEAEVMKIKRGQGKRGRIPELWDGKASERIAAALAGTGGGPSDR